MPRILLACEAGPMSDLIAAALQCQGHEVVSAHSSRIPGDALTRTLCISRFDLIIADDLMRTKIAAETIQLMKSMWPSTRILAISGKHCSGESADSLEIANVAEVTATLTRPFSTADLFRTVDGTLLST